MSTSRLSLCILIPTLLALADGTAADTVRQAGETVREASAPYLIREIQPGTETSSIWGTVVADDKIYFNAYEDVHGFELWVSDGTAQGTQMVVELVPGPASSYLSPRTYVDGTLFLERNVFDELWISDGTEEGTVIASSLPPTESGHHTSAAGLFFMQQREVDMGSEVWRSDGTASGTYGLDLLPGPAGSRPSGLVSFQDSLIFFAYGSSQILRTDGTIAGTTVVLDDVQMFDPVVHGGLIFYAGWASDMGGQEPWISDGTTEGTHRLKDINSATSSNPTAFNPVGDRVFFRANDGTHGTEWWVTDGTSEGTVLTKDINPGPQGSTPTFGNSRYPSLNGTFIFAAQTADWGSELWIGDGTENGTQMLLDIISGDSSSYPLNFRRFGDHIYFSAYRPEDGRELWKTDGTVEGTEMIDLRPGPLGFEPQLVAVTETHLFMRGDDGVHGEELWAITFADVFSDGFESGNTSSWSSTTP